MPTKSAKPATKPRAGLAADFADIALHLHQQPDMAETLDSTARLAMETVGADMCGVMLVHGGRRVESAAVTDERVAEADRLQLECRQGPCLEAIDDKTTFIIADTETDHRWVQWCRRVAPLGIRSVLSVRLFTRGGTLGSLNLYSGVPGHFDVDDAAVASIFAGHAAVAVSAAQTELGLRAAIDGRHVIGLAQGILMERFDLSQDQAFAVLRRYSQDRNMKLRAVAQHVVDVRKLPD